MAPEPVADVLAQVDAGSVPGTLEGRELEFKRADGSFENVAKTLAEAATCLANSNGGVIIVGVDDKLGGELAFLGCPFEPERLRFRIWELTSPSLAVAVETRTHRSVDLAIVTVPIGLDVHRVNGRALHRVGTTCVLMSGSEQSRLIDDRRGRDWSSERSGLRAEEAVSPLALAVARALLAVLADDERGRLVGLSDSDLLRALGVVAPDGELLNAGAVLFSEGAPGHVVAVYQYRRSPGGEPTEVQRLRGPLLLAFQRITELVSARIEKTPILLRTGQQLELADLPVGPVREALANAVAHRDWRLPDPVSIEHAPTRLVIDSPGPLVSGVTVENILAHPSKPRNRVLTEAIRKLGLAEQAGVGIDRMFRDMIRSGHAPPEISASDYVRVSLTGGPPNKPLARYIASLPALVAEDVDAMLVLFTLLSVRTVSAATLQATLQKSADEVEMVLRRLASDEIAMIEPTRHTVTRRRPNYRLHERVLSELGTATSYRRRTADEIDRKVIATVRELGSITNGVVQVLFDVRMERASRILADLVDRKILVKTSSHERGPGVTYGAGSAFPRPTIRQAPSPPQRDQPALFDP
ncbi:MAG: putative DNA binding domain-containing protein [Actinomycetota bacterium]|nr:putative DNA binding domain-containing protein [Actinomycetota bacterium]